MKKAIRASLESLQREFLRLSHAYPALYHEKLMAHEGWPLVVPGHEYEEFGSDYDTNHMTKSNWRAFAAANSSAPNNDWQEWHGPYIEVMWDFPRRPIKKALEQHSWLGRFFGNKEGMEEFKQMAESLYLILRKLDPKLPDMPGSAGVVRLMHEMANDCPTPLLRVKCRLWGTDNPDLKMEWLGPQKWGKGFLAHPSVLTIDNNLFSAAVAAIEMVIDDDILFLEQLPDDFDDYRPYPVLSDVIEPKSDDEMFDDEWWAEFSGESPESPATVISQSESQQSQALGPEQLAGRAPFQFQLGPGNTWLIAFTGANGREFAQVKQGREKGYYHLKRLLSKPDMPILYTHFFKTPGKLSESSFVSVSEHLADREGLLNLAKDLDDDERSALKPYLVALYIMRKQLSETRNRTSGKEAEGIREQVREIDKLIRVLRENDNIPKDIKEAKRKVLKSIRLACSQLKRTSNGIRAFTDYIGHVIRFDENPMYCVYRPKNRNDISADWLL